jgi:hypothetical protein
MRAVDGAIKMQQKSRIPLLAKKGCREFAFGRRDVKVK